MKRIVLFLFGMLLTTGIGYTAKAQSGMVGLGLRATPDGGGFNVKYFIDQNLSFEGQMNAGGILGLEGESFNVVGLLAYNVILPDPSWRIFFGGGAHFGVWDHDYRYNPERIDRDGDEFIFGFDGIGGAEYIFKNIPLGLSADIKPAINLVSDVDFFPHNMFGFTAKYYIR